MDSFTAGLLLQAVQKEPSSIDRIVDFGKSLKGAGISPDMLKKVNAIKDKRCKVKGTTHVGYVVGPNMAKGGFYGGERYPVLVKVESTGDTFEYDFDQVEVTEG